MSGYEVEAAGVSKAFSGVLALRDVSFGVRPGEARGLIGENGAGKSTLIKIISGAMQADAGEVRVGGQPVHFRSPHAALEQGIGTVHQRNFLVPSLTVLQNVELGHERRVTPAGWLGRRPREESVEALRFVGLEKRLSQPVGSLSLADRQLVAIARAVSRGSRLMIFDEPTAVLSPVETTYMFDVIDRLRAAGTALVYVTHRLEELPRVVSAITVMRDGQVVAEADPSRPVRELVELMAGQEALAHEDEQRAAAQRRARTRPAEASPLVSVRGLGDSSGAFRDVSFDLARGEILSLVGLPDSGVSEIVATLSGARRQGGGEVLVEGRRIASRSPRRAVRDGIGYVSGDRGQKGVIPNFSVRRTATISSLDRVGRLSVIQPAREGRLASRFLEQCQVRAASSAMSITALSGGNQQKALMARMLAAEPRVLVFEDPTAGVDVAGREALYDLVADCCERGHAVIWTSSDLREVTTVCDRAIVLWRGSVVREIQREGLTVRALMAAQFNQADDAPIQTPVL
jgi:ABC-type sugar transport system ATPase subunit